MATVLINNAPYANAKRGCTEEKRSFKVGSPPVPLVPFATSPKAADPIACRDECIGPPLPTKCSCPVGEEYCTADKRCYRQQPLVCPSSLDVIAGGCDCCGAVDSEFGFCFPGACHPKITWFEYKCPCQRKGTSCTTNDACCGEKCDVPGGQSQGTCRCLNPGEKCHVSRDCCSYTANESVQSCGKALVNGGYYGNCK